jgi:hypothetical protein
MLPNAATTRSLRIRVVHAATPQEVVIPAKAGIQYAAAFRFIVDVSGILDHPPSRVMTRGARSKRASSLTNTPSHSRSTICPSLACSFRPLFRGRRECRASDAPAAACAKVESKKHTRQSGHTGITRHSPRNGFNGFLRALPGDRALLPPSSAKIAFRQLDTSVGVSGPHDFSVRFRTVRYRRFRVHRIPSRVRDDREPPLCGTRRLTICQ